MKLPKEKQLLLLCVENVTFKINNMNCLNAPMFKNMFKITTNLLIMPDNSAAKKKRGGGLWRESHSQKYKQRFRDTHAMHM